MTSIELETTAPHWSSHSSVGAVEQPFRATTPWVGDERLRRALNVAVALIGLGLAAPIMLLLAGLIKLTSRGPVIFSQERVGLDRRWLRDRRTLRGLGRRNGDVGGRPFTIYKFRTMRIDDDADAQVWASPDDPRVTALGRFLRRYRLDELPQLWNVLKGDMNIVGPRPEQPRIFGKLRSAISGYPNRQRVLPGITGWAQINLTYDQCLEDVERKVAYDLQYVARCSASEDFRIMVRTVPVMAFKRGAW